MTLYFAYGSNMSRAGMKARCPGSRALGPARLDNYKFFVGIDGWGSVKPSRGDAVHGVLWRLTPRDVAAMHAYELLHAGLYDVRHLPVRMGARLAPAMIYLLRRRAAGRPKPGYVELIAASARDWRLPERYIEAVERWSTSRFAGAHRLRQTGVTAICHMIVHGRVQGVGFRAFVEYEALKRGVGGWVCNRRDGSVEAVFEGEAAVVVAMIEACGKGPLGARVDALHQREGTAEDLKFRRPGELFSVLSTA